MFVLTRECARMQEPWPCQFRQTPASQQRTPPASAYSPLQPRASIALWGHMAVGLLLLEVRGVADKRGCGIVDYSRVCKL